MARGQRTNDELKEQIKAALASNNNVREIARKFGVSPSTVMKIRDEKPDEFERLRTDKREQMIGKIWANMEDALELGHQMIREAKQGSRDIPLGQVSTYFGTLYDKQALMNDENTSNVGVSGEVDIYEHILDELAGD